VLLGLRPRRLFRPSRARPTALLPVCRADVASALLAAARVQDPDLSACGLAGTPVRHPVTAADGPIAGGAAGGNRDALAGRIRGAAESTGLVLAEQTLGTGRCGRQTEATAAVSEPECRRCLALAVRGHGHTRVRRAARIAVRPTVAAAHRIELQRARFGLAGAEAGGVRGAALRLGREAAELALITAETEQAATHLRLRAAPAFALRRDRHARCGGGAGVAVRLVVAAAHGLELPGASVGLREADARGVRRPAERLLGKATVQIRRASQTGKASTNGHTGAQGTGHLPIAATAAGVAAVGRGKALPDGMPHAVDDAARAPATRATRAWVGTIEPIPPVAALRIHGYLAQPCEGKQPTPCFHAA